MMEVEQRKLATENKRIDKKTSDNDEVHELESVKQDGQNPKLLSSIYNYMVIISIILIVFAAFRNSVTW